MAIHFSDGTKDLHRTAGAFLSNGSNWTAMMWVRFDNTTSGGKYRTIFVLMTAGFAEYVAFYTGIDDNVLELDTFNGAAQNLSLQTLAAGTWCHLAVTYDSTSHVFTVYINGVAFGSTVTNDMSAVTFTQLQIGNDTGGSSFGQEDCAYFRTWQSKLTATEIQTEMASRSAVKASPFEDDWIILTSDITDHSGNARNLTANGAPSNQFGPIWPSNGVGNLGNLDGSTAKEVAVGFSETIDPKDAAYIWYKHTAQPGEIVVGAWGFGGLGGTYIPQTNVRSPLASGTSYLGMATAFNVPLQIPVTPGTVYYFRVGTNQVIATGFSLTFKLDLAPNSIAPVGSIVVNDDAIGFPVAFLDQTTGFPVQFLQGTPAGESMVTTTSGIIAMSGVRSSILLTDDIVIYNPAFQVVAVITTGFTNFVECMTCDMSSTFYALDFNTGLLKAWDTAGNFIRSWTLPITNAQSIAVTHDNTILYYSTGNSINQPIKRFDLVNNIALSDLAAGVPTYFTVKRNGILCLSNGDVIVAYQGGGSGNDLQPKRYSSAGTTLNTYTFGDTLPPDTRPTMAIDDPNSFWLWTKNLVAGAGDGKDRFRNVRCSDGVILHDIPNVQEYEGGIYNSAANASPDRFGHSESCHFIILRVALNPTAGQFSGVYILVPHRPHDTVYTSIIPGNPPTTTTQDVKIP
jgi:Concanavalin A-like lectin/glucanases superfamily